MYSSLDDFGKYQGNSPWCYSVQRANSFASDQPFDTEPSSDSTTSTAATNVVQYCDTDNDCIESQTCFECLQDCTGVVNRCSSVLPNRCEDGIF